MIRSRLVMVPLYGLVRWLGGSAPCTALGRIVLRRASMYFLLRRFFRTIRGPSEAARIDGCGEFRIFGRSSCHCEASALVVGRCSRPRAWNDFLGPLIYLTDEKDFTLALGSRR